MIWLVIFTAEATCLNGWLAVVSSASMAGLTAAATAAAVGLVRLGTSGLGGASLVKTLTYAVGAVWFSRAADRGDRRRWLQQRALAEEQRLFRERLFDLLPRPVAARRLAARGAGAPPPPPEPLEAAVLPGGM